MRKLALVLVAASASLFADGNSDTAKAEAKVHIVAPVKIISEGSINFGKIVVDDYNVPASVTMKVTTSNNGYTQATLTDWVACAPFKNSLAGVDAAQFHYSQDVQTSVAANVKVTIPATVTLTGGHGPACTLETLSDLPADDCSLANIKGQIEINDYVKFKHFGVGGKLNIPAKSLGEKKGELTVKVEYI